MTINKALKHKNKLVRKINNLKSLIRNYNSTYTGQEVPYDVREKILEYADLKDELITLKTKIQLANNPIAMDLVLLNEIKGDISFLQSLDTFTGSKSVGYGGEVEKSYEAEMKTLERDNLVKTHEEKLESLQERIDQHNATTSI